MEPEPETEELTLQQVGELFAQSQVRVKTMGYVTLDGERVPLIAPTTSGQKIAFHLGETTMRDVCAEYTHQVENPHEQCQMVVVHVHLDDESVGVLRRVNTEVKEMYRQIPNVHCPQWMPLVRTLKGTETLPVDV